MWAIVKARNKDEIVAKYPFLTVVEDRPGWMSEAEYNDIVARDTYDIDDSASGWLAVCASEHLRHPSRT